MSHSTYCITFTANHHTLYFVITFSSKPVCSFLDKSTDGNIKFYNSVLTQGQWAIHLPGRRCVIRLANCYCLFNDQWRPYQIWSHICSACPDSPSWRPPGGDETTPPSLALFGQIGTEWWGGQVWVWLALWQASPLSAAAARLHPHLQMVINRNYDGN